VLVVLNVLPMLTLFVPRLAGQAMVSGEWRDAFLPRSESDWILAQTGQLGGFGGEDLMAARYLRQQSAAGDRVLVNGPHAKARDIHYDSTLTALSGRRSVGHSLPWPQEPVGTPPFHRSATARVFWQRPSLDLLDQMEVDWVLLRPVPRVSAILKEWLNQNCRLVWQNSDYRLYQRTSKKVAPVKGVSPSLSHLPPPIVSALPIQYAADGMFRFQLKTEGHLWAWAFVAAGAAAESLDLHELVVGRGGASAGVVPAWPGEFELVFFEVDGTSLRPSARRYPLRVVERGLARPEAGQRR
jgi:hypothetical protein